MGTPTDTISYGYGSTIWGDLLTSYDGTTITYDTIGNPLGDGTWAYTWAQGRQLASMTSGATTWSFSYDANGLRTGRNTSSTEYDYVYNESGQLTQIKYESLILNLAYDAEGRPVSISYNSKIYYFVLNLQGDVVALVDSSGNQVVGYTYDAWGKPLSITGSMKSTLGQYNPLRYRSYVYDRETGLYYLQSRYYDPEIGRWINADNNFSDNNLFMYCGNNPTNRIDPNGEHWYYLWIDDLLQAVDELMASVSNIVYGQAAHEMSFYNPRGASNLWNSRPFQDTKPSQEMQIFAEFMYNHDFVADVSVSIDTKKNNTYFKFGVSKVLSPSKNIDASYAHAGIGQSTASVLPINITYSVGFTKGVNVKEDYAKSFLDSGAGAIYGFDYCFWPNGSSAYSFTIGTSYGVYAGYDYYWCLD
ncbi:MAG: RHS repeat-associated core domain-containing protein [Oscillospiraceae bacterium]|nr:RHS repeat-associated core domain-containing protein [Oscillospiraceae bacterium]